MKKLLWMGLLLILSVSCCGFSSCRGPQYEEAVRDAMEEAGRKQMQAWLDEHIEGAGVISAEAYIEMYPSGPYYLTDSVYGSYRNGEEERLYEIEVEENKVYLACDMGILTEELKPYILETLGLSGYEEECEISSVDGMIVGNIETAEYPYEDNYEYLTGLCYLPGELVLAMEESGFEVIEDEEQKKYARADTAEEEIEEDREETDEEEQKNRIIWSEQAYKLMRDFVREPQSRPEITVACALTVPEETDLRTYDMAYFQETRKRSGMNFQINLYQDQVWVYSDEWKTIYERTTRQPFEDFFVEYTEEFLREDANSQGEIHVAEQFSHDVRDLSLIRTEEGYSFAYKDPDDIFYFEILADENAEIRQHEYTDRYDRELNLRPSDKISGDRYFIWELVWKEREDGYWTLIREDNGSVQSFSNADELIIRDC